MRFDVQSELKDTHTPSTAEMSVGDVNDVYKKQRQPGPEVR